MCHMVPLSIQKPNLCKKQTKQNKTKNTTTGLTAEDHAMWSPLAVKVEFCIFPEIL